MTDFNPSPRKVHEGRNVKRFREMLGIKQEALAVQLNEDWTQVNISRLEQKESIDDALLQQIAEVLKIPVEAFRNFDEEAAVNLISCTFSDNAVFSHRGEVQQTIHPVDQLIKLHEEKIALYERMLKEKEEMMLALKQLLDNKIE